MSETLKNIDEMYMLRCLKLAKLGLGSVGTNPLVGSVIVYNGAIIGEGYHKKYGEAHAEVNAINSVEDKQLLAKSTLYVNLEPCAHYGKTPPCADLVVSYNIKRVVIGTIDTYSEVAGKGIEKLKKADIDVTVGVLDKECRVINKRFFTYHEKNRPYIILKWAETADGFIGRKTEQNKLTKRISNEYVDVEVHKWRANESAILVGTNTALADNPKLTVRHINGRNPIRVIIDYDLKIPNTFHIYNSATKTIVINSVKQEQRGNVFFEKVADKSLVKVFEILFQHEIQSVLVEGGAKLLQSIIDNKLWDEARIIKTEKYWRKGVKAPKIKGTVTDVIPFKGDKLMLYSPN